MILPMSFYEGSTLLARPFLLHLRYFCSQCSPFFPPSSLSLSQPPPFQSSIVCGKPFFFPTFINLDYKACRREMPLLLCPLEILPLFLGLLRYHYHPPKSTLSFQKCPPHPLTLSENSTPHSSNILL